MRVCLFLQRMPRRFESWCVGTERMYFLACVGDLMAHLWHLHAETVFLNGMPATRMLRWFSSCGSRVGLFILADTIERRMVRP